MEANDFVNFKVNVDKSPVDVSKKMAIHAKKKSNFYAQQSLSDGKMKKIQTTIQRLFTNVHTHQTRLFKNQMD